MTEPKRKPKNGLTEILIVEDSPTQAAKLEHILQRAGYKVTAASNGKEALTCIGRRKPTLVISDILMPEMDGYEMCKRLKSDAGLSSIPIILLTTLNDPKDVVKGLECGADHFITKPYDEKLLVSRVRGVLSNLDLRKTQKMGMGVEILIAGQRYFITSDRMQILDFLISTYETAVQQNRELAETRDKLNELNEKLEEKVKERTSELIAEVAQRIKAEESIEHLNSVLRALRNVNQLITKENDSDKLLKGACDTMTDTRGFRSAWIALIDDDGKLLFTAESGFGKAFLPMLEQLQRGELPECGRHVIKRPGLFMKDSSTECVDCPLAETLDGKMIVVARLEHGNKTYGILAVYLPYDILPDMEEQSLFQELVDDIAFGLHKIELGEQRKKAEENLVKSYESLKKTLNDAINTMVKIVEIRDPYTAGHQHRVADLATAIAGEMKLEDIRIDQIRTAAVIHDIGKIHIPSDILSKPGRLSDIEFSLIKTHAQNGYDIVNGMNFPGIVAQAVLQHHERLDGSGYPNQLKGKDTLLEAKILAVADVIEAMASHRPYRPALGIDKALDEISKNKGRLYDPDVVDACLELFGVRKFEFKGV